MKVGVLGTGGIGNVHARQYAKMPDVQVHGFDTDVEKRGKFCAQWGATECTSLDELLGRIDILDICLPTDAHLEFGLKGLEAGKAVFVEKPITRTMAEARELMAAAKNADRPLMVGQVVRFFPEYSAAHRAIQAGKIGTPAAVRMRRGGLAPQGSEGWFQNLERSGGVLLDLAVHEFDWLTWTLGEATQVYSRSVRLGETVQDAEFVGDYALTTITFANGAVAHVESTWLDPSGFRVTLEVAGSEGLIEYDSRQNPTLRTHVTGQTRNESLMAPNDDPYFRLYRACVDSVRDGTPPPVSGEEAVRALALSLAAIESAKTGQPVTPER